MGVLYLVRHGQARAQAYGAGAWAQAEGGLTDLGAEQARRAGTALAARLGRIDHAVSGDLARQRETLRRIVDELPGTTDPAIDARWNEYDIDSILGDRERTENATERGFQAQLDGALSDWIAGIAVGSETYEQYRQRADAAFDNLIAHAGSGKTVLAVSSAGTIAAIIARLWGIDDDRWLAIARTMINTSVTKILIGSSGASVVSINDHAHVDHADDRRLMTFR
ncbi:histidine phosphatase family protein [Williamsia phyllosphaerae]|uniref:Phosphoglycerate mutase n=1 Tax=Williamsia phyllosphaerae TaxID=885042 RepID=A0ABQ1UDV9_9NOCA|nr:histidine phosphatase family protein [Williamsia phyllosphaerae]GGF14601.1 phosphoglycerate mutase [Williamsia phyllosphaerae]